MPWLRVAEQLGADFDVARAAGAALGETGNEKAGPATGPNRFFVEIRTSVPFETPLARLNGVPELLGNNTQFRNVPHDPAVVLIEP